MCHVVRPDEGRFFFQPKARTFIGLKAMDVVEGAFVSAYSKQTYDMRAGDNSFLALELSLPAVEQDVEFGLPGKTVWAGGELRGFRMAIYRPQMAGCHISSFREGGKEEVEIVDPFVRVPVLFEERDVLFFDGRDVSVEKFSLLHPLALEGVLTTLEKFLWIGEGKERFVEKYEALIRRVKNGS